MHIVIHHLRLLCAGQHLKEIGHVEINSMGLVGWLFGREYDISSNKHTEVIYKLSQGYIYFLCQRTNSQGGFLSVPSH